MKERKVKDIMVPLGDYAIVSKNANLTETIRSLENQKKSFGGGPYRHRAVLVVDDDGQVVGKVSQLDIMRALEPNYQRIGTDVRLSRFGFSRDFMNSMVKQYQLWERSLEMMCKIAEETKVSKIMYTPADHQKVKEDDSIFIAMHQIVMGQHQSLLVTKKSGKEIIGILRSTDVFNALFDMMEQIKCSDGPPPAA